MTEFSLTARPRSGTGKGAARKLRSAGHIPGVIYGLNDPISIQLEEKELSHMVQTLHGGERLITLRLSTGEEGKEGEDKNVLVKEIQITAIRQLLLHVDFQEIDIKRKVQVAVELRPVGQPVGVKLGGILQAVKHDVVIECLPTEIPEYIEADVEELEIGDSLHVSDLSFPKGVSPVTDAEETLIVISAPRVEEVEEEEEEAIEGEEVVEGEEGEAASEEESEQE